MTEIKKKIQEAAKDFAKKESSDKPFVTITHKEFNLGILITYNEAAEFGYQLAKEEIARLRRFVESLAEWTDEQCSWNDAGVRARGSAQNLLNNL